MRSLRRPRSPSERQRQEDAETQDDILQPSAPAVEQKVPEDPVSGPPGES